MERNEAPTPFSERDQRSEVDEQTRRELGSHAIADQLPFLGFELDLPPPYTQVNRRGRAHKVAKLAARTTSNLHRGRRQRTAKAIPAAEVRKGWADLARQEREYDDLIVSVARTALAVVSSTSQQLASRPQFVKLVANKSGKSRFIANLAVERLEGEGLVRFGHEIDSRPR